MNVTLILFRATFPTGGNLSWKPQSILKKTTTKRKLTNKKKTCSIKKQRHIARPLLCETGPRRKIPYEGGRTQPIFLFLLFALSNISSSVPNKKNVKMFPFFPTWHRIWIDIYGLRRDKSPIHADRKHVYKKKVYRER